MTTRRIRRRISVLLTAVAIVICGKSRAVCQETTVVNPATKDALEAHLGKGYEAVRQERYEVAVSEFRAALELDPKLVLRARFPLAVALFEMHNSEEARHEFEVIRREVGDHPNVLYYLGRMDLTAGNIEGAIQKLSAAVAKPPFPDTAYYLGFAYLKRGDLSAAEKWLKEAARLNPQDSRIPYQLGLVYRKQGREEEATNALALSGELHERDANESKLRNDCAQKLDQGPREEARAICEKLYAPDDAEKLTMLGTIYAEHGDLEDALKPLRRAAELAPQSPQMQYNLAMAYYQLNRFEDARAPLADALMRWPDLFQLNALQGAILLKLGEEFPAYQALQHAHRLNPQDPATADLLYLTTVRMAQKSQDAQKYSDALRYLGEAAQLRPLASEPHRRMAELYKLTGRPAQAAVQQQQADRLNKRDATARP